MEHIIYLSDEFTNIHTSKDEYLNLNDRICMIETRKKERIYFKIISETAKTFTGIRLQQDQYNNNKFYLTDEKNKWHGIVNDGSFVKGRWICVFN